MVADRLCSPSPGVTTWRDRQVFQESRALAHMASGLHVRSHQPRRAARAGRPPAAQPRLGEVVGQEPGCLGDVRVRCYGSATRADDYRWRVLFRSRPARPDQRRTCNASAARRVQGGRCRRGNDRAGGGLGSPRAVGELPGPAPTPAAILGAPEAVEARAAGPEGHGMASSWRGRLPWCPLSPPPASRKSSMSGSAPDEAPGRHPSSRRWPGCTRQPCFPGADHRGCARHQPVESR